MKPISLAMKGFRSYPKPVTIDFTDKGLTAVLGDTGAGKSSILEAITFALFGKSSWDGRETKLLIADHVDTASVELSFLHGSHRWQVHRTIHATNSNAGRHHLKNLDTGEEVDGATAVTNRVEAVLQLGYAAFLRVGLLPQGKFDQLLTSKPGDRKKHLRELFGAESLLEVQDVARERASNLEILLEKARATRKPMPDDPAQTAADFAAKAAASESLVARLVKSIGTISALQDTVSTARKASSAAQKAAEDLAEGVVHDAVTTLDKLTPIAEDLQKSRISLDVQANDLATRENELAEQIQQRAQAGESLAQLGSAAAVLANLAERIDGHRQQRDDLEARNAQLAEAADRMSSDATELDDQSSQIQPLVDKSAIAAKAGQNVGNCAGELRSQVASTIRVARLVADGAAAGRSAADELGEAKKAVMHLEEDLTEADAVVTVVEQKVGRLELQDRVAAITADVHPGDDCPVCGQQVPDPFEGGVSAGGDEINKARSALAAAKRQHGKISGDLSSAKVRVVAATKAVSVSTQRLHEAEAEAERTADATYALFEEFSALAIGVGGSFDAAAASAALVAAIDRAASPGDHDNEQPQTKPITSAIARCEESVSTHVRQLRDNELQATLGIKSAREALTTRRSAHLAAVAEAGKAAHRETTAMTRTTAVVRGLPARIRRMLPEALLSITDEAVIKAIDAVTAVQTEIDRVVNEQEDGRRSSADIVSKQQQLDRETRRCLDTPLATLQGELGIWAKELHRAVDYVGGGYQATRTSVERDIAETRSLVNELRQTTAKVASDLASACAAHTAEYEDAAAKLADEISQLPDVLGIDADVDWTKPQAIHPLIDAKSAAGKDAEKLRAEESAVKALVQQAADLDFAIAAGDARLAALKVLRRELVDAKFLGHLTTLNTRALLGIASTLLGQLTENQFGFALNCDIVSRGSKVEHSANRLSGGEKFLASLALALALAELHSLSGPRLGALFLDEGFATLDADALQSALDVLRAQTGDDRLVMVISHLHAVAEAVDNVLWVERPNGGSSTARWLTDDERDELVNADLVSGLQALT